MDIYTAEAQQRPPGSGWKVVLQVIVIAVGLVLGAFLGVIGALFFGLINISC